MIRDTEQRRGRRIIKTKQWKSRRHRRCIERRSLFANTISNLYTKRLPQNSYQESVRYTSIALCAVGTSVTLRYLRPLRDSVCLLYSHPLKTIFQHKACTDKLYADSFYKVQKNSHSSFEVICCRR